MGILRLVVQIPLVFHPQKQLSLGYPLPFLHEHLPNLPSVAGSPPGSSVVPSMCAPSTACTPRATSAADSAHVVQANPPIYVPFPILRLGMQMETNFIF